MEYFFLLGFCLHNLEEGLWLPEWSKHAQRFSRVVEPGEFRFAVVVVTSLGIGLTFLHRLLRQQLPGVEYVYGGFVGMMMVNAFLPHLAATIALRRYAPGTLTGLILNVPIGAAVLHELMGRGVRAGPLALATAVVGASVLASLGALFRLGRSLVAPR